MKCVELSTSGQYIVQTVFDRISLCDFNWIFIIDICPLFKPKCSA